MTEQTNYSTKFQELFPNIEPVLQGDTLAIFNLACSTGLQNEYVTKSDKLAQLEKEKLLAWQLKEKSDLLWSKLCKDVINQGEYRYKDPTKDPNLPHISCQPLVYAKYKKECVWEQILSIMAQNKELSNFPKYWELGRRISCNVDSFYDSLCIAIEQENKGTTGENAVADYIRRATTCRVFQNVVLPTASGDTSKTAESDLVLVTANGIFVCEVKSYGKAGQTLQIDPDGTFRKLDSRGNWLKDYASPFEQNERHCRSIWQVLYDRGITNVPIYSVVVVSNPDINIQNYSNMSVVNQYQLCDMIQYAEQSNLLNSNQINHVCNAVQGARIEERAFPIMRVPYDMYDFCLGALLHYVEEYSKWASDCSKRLTEWAEACNKLWEDLNHEAVKKEKTATCWRRIITAIVCCAAIALAIWLIITFWEQIITAIGMVLLIGLFDLMIRLFAGS